MSRSVFSNPRRWVRWVLPCFSVVLLGVAASSFAKNAKARKDPQPLNGQKLYATHCSRCHTERYPTEFTAAQWKTIVFEMRVRANLPAKQARAILKYLQADAGK